MQLPDLGDVGKQARSHITSASFRDDVSQGRGLSIVGSARKRTNALPVLCKELVLLNYGVRLITLNTIMGAGNSEDGAELMHGLRRCQVLCIDRFQFELSECPYNFRERQIVEDLVMARIENTKPVVVSACKRLHECDWWSGELVTLMGGRNVEIAFGF